MYSKTAKAVTPVYVVFGLILIFVTSDQNTVMSVVTFEAIGRGKPLLNIPVNLKKEL